MTPEAGDPTFMPQWPMKIALLAGLSLPFTALAHEHGGANPAGEVGHGTTTSVRKLTVVEREDGTMGFAPDTLRVKRGETVRFDITNAGKANHEFRIDSVAGNAAHEAMMRAMPDMKHHEGNSVALAPGTTGHLAWTFTHAGTFQFACLIPGHFEAGMHGTILVERLANADARRPQ